MLNNPPWIYLGKVEDTGKKKFLLVAKCVKMFSFLAQLHSKFAKNTVTKSFFYTIYFLNIPFILANFDRKCAKHKHSNIAQTVIRIFVNIYHSPFDCHSIRNSEDPYCTSIVCKSPEIFNILCWYCVPKLLNVLGSSLHPSEN
jgi:hypothetical protein